MSSEKIRFQKVEKFFHAKLEDFDSLRTPYLIFAFIKTVILFQWTGHDNMAKKGSPVFQITNTISVLLLTRDYDQSNIKMLSIRTLAHDAHCLVQP